jgi:hypothetical protein
MRRVSFQHVLFMLSAVSFSYYLSVTASASQLNSKSAKILSCDELRNIHHDLADKSRDELRELIYQEFRANWNETTAKAYALAKYYCCRFPDETDDFALYLKKWVEKYEEAQREAETESRPGFH